MSETSEAPEKRSSWQFGLRWLLLLMIAPAIYGAFWYYQVQEIRERRMAWERITKLRQSAMESGSNIWIWQSGNDPPASPVPWWLPFSGEEAVHRITHLSFDIRSHDDGFEEPGPIRDEDLQLLLRFPELETLGIPRSKVTYAGLALLPSFPNLTALDLSNTAITDDGLEYLGKLRSLTHLTLDRTNISGRGLAHLAECPIERLSLNEVPLQTEHLALLERLKSLDELVIHSSTLQHVRLADLPKLRVLNLVVHASEVRIELERLRALQTATLFVTKEKGLQSVRLRNLDGLRDLHLVDKGLSPRATDDWIFDGPSSLNKVRITDGRSSLRLVPFLANYSTINSLSLGDMGYAFGDDDIARFAKHIHLAHLTLSGTSITDAGMQSIAALPGLESLTLQSRKITVAGIEVLASSAKLRMLQLSGIEGFADPGPAFAKLPQVDTLGLANFACRSFTLVPSDSSEESLKSKLTRLNVSGHQLESLRIANLPQLNSINLQLTKAKSCEITDLTRLEKLDISFKPSQVVEKFILSRLPELHWLSLQCGPTGTLMPADMFDNLASFKKLKAGTVWGLTLPPQAKSQLFQFRAATGVKLD